MRVTHKGLLAIVAVVAVGAAIGIAVQWPSGPEEPEPTDEFVDESELHDARLLEVIELESHQDDPSMLPGATTVEVTAEIEGSAEVVTFEMTDETGDTYAEGQRVRLASIPSDVGEGGYYINDFRRGPALSILSVLFVAAVLALGRFQGLRALLGLGLSFLVIIGFIVPSILDGRSPVTVALAGSVAVMLLTLYLSHGLGPKTSAAVVGTAGALLLTVALAGLFTSTASLTGFTSEDARLANYEVGGLSLRGLLLAGIIIGGLGVLDDVTMSQSSTVFALRRANPRMPFGRLFAEGLSVGRDHIAATVNTLCLAYAGAALPLMLLLTTGEAPLASVVTSEVVAVEIVRTLVGSLGLIAAVPLTTALAAAVARGDEPEDTHAHAHAHGPGLEVAKAEEQRAEGESGATGSVAGEDGSRVAASDGDDDEIWVQRLKSAYRLPSDGGERPDL